MKEKVKQILLYLEPIIFVILIIVLIFFIYTTQTSGAKCMANPMVYGAKILSDNNKADFSCYCYFSNNPSQRIGVNKTAWFYDTSFNSFKGFG